MSGVDNMNYMYRELPRQLDTTLIVNFDNKNRSNTDLILTQARETQARPQVPRMLHYGSPSKICTSRLLSVFTAARDTMPSFWRTAYIKPPGPDQGSQAWQRPDIRGGQYACGYG